MNHGFFPPALRHSGRPLELRVPLRVFYRCRNRIGRNSPRAWLNQKNSKWANSAKPKKELGPIPIGHVIGRRAARQKRNSALVAQSASTSKQARTPNADLRARWPHAIPDGRSGHGRFSGPVAGRRVCLLLWTLTEGQTSAQRLSPSSLFWLSSACAPLRSAPQMRTTGPRLEPSSVFVSDDSSMCSSRSCSRFTYVVL